MIKSKKIISTYFSNTQKIITSLDMIQINKLVEIIDKVRKKQKRPRSVETPKQEVKTT